MFDDTRDPTMTTIDTHATLAALVTARPVLATALDRVGLDYCCGGRRTFAEAVLGARPRRRGPARLSERRPLHRRVADASVHGGTVNGTSRTHDLARTRCRSTRSAWRGVGPRRGGGDVGHHVRRVRRAALVRRRFDRLPVRHHLSGVRGDLPLSHDGSTASSPDSTSKPNPTRLRCPMKDFPDEPTVSARRARTPTLSTTTRLPPAGCEPTAWPTASGLVWWSTRAR